jgi:hypothetical protein
VFSSLEVICILSKNAVDTEAAKTKRTIDRKCCEEIREYLNVTNIITELCPARSQREDSLFFQGNGVEFVVFRYWEWGRRR